MRGKSTRGKLVVSLMLVLLCLPFVLAIGVTPADSYLTYTPKESLNIDLTLNFRSTETPPGVANITLLDEDQLRLYIIEYKDGWSGLNSSEIEEYVKIDKTFFDFSKGGGAVTVKVKIPPYAPIYGPHEFGIKATEVPPSRGGISVGTAVIHRVKIDAPFPGQYAEIANFDISNVNEGELATLTWSVIGRSEKDTSCYTDLEIFSSEGDSVYRKNLGIFSVNRGEVYPSEGENRENIPTRDFVPGRYTGVLTLNFAGMTKTKTVIFNVGTESVFLENYTPVNLTTGEINEITIITRNLWNGEFANTYAAIDIAGIKATTPSGVLGPFAILELKQFVDTRSLLEGSYDANITMFFGANKMTFPASFNVVNKTLPVIIEEKKDNSKYYVLGAVVLAVILIIFIVVLVKKRHREMKEGESYANAKITSKLEDSEEGSVTKKARSKSK